MHHDGQLIVLFQRKKPFQPTNNQRLGCSQSEVHVTQKNMFRAMYCENY